MNNEIVFEIEELDDRNRHLEYLEDYIEDIEWAKQFENEYE